MTNRLPSENQRIVGNTTVRMVNNVGSQCISIELRRPLPVAHRDHIVVKFDSDYSHA